MQSQLEHILAAGDFDTAINLLQAAINEEPGNQGFRVELADVLLRKGSVDDARTVLASIPEDTAERERPQNRLEFIEEAAGFDTPEALQAQLEQNADDLEAKYQLAVQMAVAEQYESALDLAMDILRIDREFRDDIGRLTMVRIFPLMGKGNEAAGRYRRKMFNFMH
jgi:putative thioredoxin